MASVKYVSQEGLLAGATAIPDVPDAPTIGAATNIGTSRAFNNASATVTYTAKSTGGVVSTFTATSSPGGLTGTGSSPITITGLQSATSYTFTVTGTNATATSAASDATSSITATTVPQAPTIGTATSGNANATVTYTSGDTGGSAITTFTATSSPGGLTGTGSSPITVSGLTNGTSYTFTVAATNINGTSTSSSASNSVTPIAPSYYVMGGDTGGLAYSTNLSSWTNITTPQPTYNWYGVAKGAGVWAISGQNGLIYSSTDLSTWTERLNTGTNFTGDMKFGSGSFVVTGESKQLYTSTNGTSWTQRTPGFVNNVLIRGVVNNTANNLWIVCGNWDSTSGAQYSYANQASLGTWTQKNIWTSGTTAYKPDANNSVVAVPVSGGYLLKSSDGISSWGGVSPDSNGVGGVAWGNSTWVVVGANGQISKSTSASANGGTFTTVTVGSSTFRYVKFVNGNFVIGSNDTPTFYSSTDGATWTSRSALSGGQNGNTITYA